MPIEPNLYSSVNIDLAQQVEDLKNEVNERDSFIQDLRMKVGEMAPDDDVSAIWTMLTQGVPENRRYTQ